MEGVLRTAHLFFTSGYAPSEGDLAVRPEVCAEAIRLVAVIDDLPPGRTDVQALRSLLELQHARRDARADAAGTSCCSPNKTVGAGGTMKSTAPWSDCWPSTQPPASPRNCVFRR
ncbi:DUF6596 domain-containing protein [Aeromicrobium camelliae]|uniref:DUF6596 domain-containing protein n=1 Tax=Aeromicrobium camelliae TaxID=1538144 RepID=UPI0036300034